MESNNNSDQLNFVLVGCGRISQAYLEALSAIPDSTLKAVVDVRPKVAQSVANRFGCQPYTDYRRASNENQVNAAIVCTPPNTHAEIASFFLENGIHVLCEKPLALSSNEAEQMIRTAEDNGRHLMMASKFRYVDDVTKAKGIIESGALGDIVLFENVFCSRVDMHKRWNSDRDISGGGVLIDNGTHSVDIARYLLGPIEKIQAEEGKRIQNIGVEDTACAYFKTHSNVLGTIDLSWSIFKEKEAYIEVYGTEGVLSIGWKRSGYRQNGSAGWTWFGSGYDKVGAFTRNVNNLIGVIGGTETPLINGIESVASVEVIEAAYKSMQMNKWVEVDI